MRNKRARRGISTGRVRNVVYVAPPPPYKKKKEKLIFFEFFPYVTVLPLYDNTTWTFTKETHSRNLKNS